MIKVAIANDTLIALEALRRVIATDPAYELIWTAKNGADAVTAAERDRPDLILMDLLMPGLDGVEATRQIMARSPCAILIVTSSLHRNTSKIFAAMGYGALEVVQTPVLEPLPQSNATATATLAAQPLLAKMMTVAKLIGKFKPTDSTFQKTSPPAGFSAPSNELIVIGASTGGPKALGTILSQLSPNFQAAIVVVQHIDVQFADGLSNWLRGQSALPVALAKAGDRPAPGKVLLAQAHGHLIMRCDRTLTYVPTDSALAANNVYCPSVDMFFQSVAQHWPVPGRAALLTGMGRDGAIGLGALRTAGWQTIAESKQSCVVYGMPRAAIEMGAAANILTIDEIARLLSYSKSPPK